MLTEICAEIRNFFCMEADKVFGTFEVAGGAITPPVGLESGQYYRIVGSVFNDGVHKYGDPQDTLKDEGKFDGAIWPMRVPPEFVALANEIKAWQTTFASSTGVSMSPYTSESFGGYSYSKAANKDGSTGASWRDAFAPRLNVYRRIRL